ncbi:transposase [Aeoliella sp. ICT_H6.2]|uniref:Transposase n=1 Tax=Aeoliella straminimaris TaxID=2954799 RepID=A0A9X2FEW2_9BACT|nr:transposase [Aeoliella straminimaris]MCO6046928.1 transposase [Aeoliella straminimaris]
MSSAKPHRKRVRHFDQQGEIHELTFSCYHRWPLLEDDWRREQLSQSIERAMASYHWRLAAFVYMPEHVHLLVLPTAPGAKVDKLLFAIKRPLSYRVKQQLRADNDPLVQRLTVRQRPGKTTFRFWQEGPGYDRNIRSAEALQGSIEYIHLNPVRRGLVDKAIEYPWSSARWYAAEGPEQDVRLPRLSAVPPDWFAGESDFTSY